MTNEVLFVGKNPEGKIFTLFGDKESLKVWANQFINASTATSEEDEDFDEDYSLAVCDKDTSGARFTLEERQADIEKLKAVLEGIDKDGFKTIFLKLPRKKNKSLAKNRVTCLWRGETFQHYWEDSYGFNAPELSVKSVDDYKAVLELTERVVGY